MSDLIDRHEAINALYEEFKKSPIKILPSAQPEQTDCEYCHEDSDGYVRPIEKNSHAVIYGSVLHLKAKGWSEKVQIKYCPMCGRRLTDG